MRLLLYVLVSLIARGEPNAPASIITTEQLEAAVIKAYRETPGFKAEMESVFTSSGTKRGIRGVIENKNDYSSSTLVSDQDGPFCIFTHSAVNANSRIEIAQQNLRDNNFDTELVPLIQVQKDGGTHSRVVEACEFGLFIGSWLGKDAYFQGFLKRMIFPNARYLGVRKVDGHDCDAIKIKRLLFKKEYWYFDRKTHLLRRWKYTRDGIARTYTLTYSDDGRLALGSGDVTRAVATFFSRKGD